MTDITRIVDNQNIDGTSDNDFISIVGSNNTITAKAGDDTLDIAGNANQIFGDDGKDILNVGGNSNAIAGGTNDDLLTVGGDENTLDGGEGNDTLDAGGNNTLIGGAGNDVFKLPDTAENGKPGQSLIQDYQNGQDKLRLPQLQPNLNIGSSDNNSRTLNFDELTIAQQGQDTAISYKEDPLALLQGISASQITASDFVA
jgi:Ca2+-binding RTX toxin-like protein